MTTNEPKKTVVESKTPKPPAEKRGSRIGTLMVGLVFAVILLAAIGWGILSREKAETTLEQVTQQSEVPFVNVIYPKSGSSGDEVLLPGNTQAFTEASIYARTSGYLKKWYFDIGAHVKAGQLLAEIETPELDQQLAQAAADLQNSQANLKISQITNTRYQDLLKSNSVSKQEADQSASDLSSKQALVDSSEANNHRLRDLQSFEKLYAPFDGIVTARNTDIGSLIQSGDNSSPKELFHLAATDKLRVFIAVPEVYVEQLRNIDKADVTLDSYPGEIFKGTVVRNSNSIDLQSRTLNVEVDIDNSSGRLLPGAYAFIHLKVPGKAGAVTIPSNTLLFRAEGLRVGVVRDGKVVLVPIVIGQDYGGTVEVVSGLSPQDVVILDPSDSITEGSKVQISNPEKK